MRQFLVSTGLTCGIDEIVVLHPGHELFHMS
jgi:hypothetical protein